MKTLTLFFALITLLILAGCEAETKDTTKTWELPPELSDCKIYSLTSTESRHIKVVHCPLSSVSIRQQVGKTIYNNQTIEYRDSKQIKIDELKAQLSQLEGNSK